MKEVLFIFLNTAVIEIYSQCQPKNLNFPFHKETAERSSTFVVEVVAEKCPGLNEFYYSWELQDHSTLEVVQRSTSSSLHVDGYNFDISQVFQNAYQITAHVSHYPDMSASASKSFSFEFIPVPMQIKLKGGDEKTHVENTDLEVNAKDLSTDRSFRSDENPLGGNKIEWFINPNLSNVDTNSLIVRVPGNLLKSGTVYNFTLKMTRTKIPKYVDTQFATQIVKIVSKGLPECSIQCNRNCQNSSPKDTTVFSVVCLKNCENVSFKWNIQPYVQPKDTDFGDGYDKLVIQPNVFEVNTNVTVTVNCRESYSSYTLLFKNSISNGTCDISPQKGVSGRTLFKVTCKGFTSTIGSLKYIIYQKNAGDTSVMLNEDAALAENKIYLTEGSPATVLVKIQDSAFMEKQVELEVDVKPFQSKSKRMTKLEAIKRIVLNDDSGSLVSLSIEQYRNKVIQIVSFVVDTIKEVKKMSDDVKRDLYKHMAEGVREVVPHNFPSAAQIISILAKMEKTKLPTDTETSKLMGKSIMNTAAVLHDITLLEETNNIPSFFLKEFVTAAFNVSSKLFTKVDDIEIALKKETKSHDYDNYDDMVSDKVRIRNDLRELTESLMISLQVFGASVLFLNIPNQKAITFETGLFIFSTRRVSTSLLNDTLTLDNETEAKIELPNAIRKELENKFNSIDYQFVVFKNDPFWWHKDSPKHNTEFILFDFFQKYHRIKAVENPFYINLRTKQIPVGSINGKVTKLQKVAAHRVTLQPNSMLLAVFSPSKECYKVTSASCYCKNEDFVGGIEICSNGSESERTLRARPDNRKNVIYVCVMNLGASELSYEGKFASFSCLYWNLKTGSWDSQGCKPIQASFTNESYMVCECTHMSFFTGEILVPPNQLNFNIEIDFYITLTENWIMVIIVTILLFIWLLLLIWAWQKDRRLEKKNFVCRLDDNIPGDSYVYLMVVFTGPFLDAETTADVAFQLIGDESKSRIHLIRCWKSKLLQRNSQDWFVVYTPSDLGNIEKIRLWHNCKGRKPHWYCKRIIVQNLQTGTQCCFLIEKWFSLIWGDGKIYREISVQKDPELKSTKVLLSIKFETQLRDKHLWLSIFTRDAQSNFNSKERVSCAVCVMFLSMLASAMFFGIPTGTPEDSIDPKPSYYITFTEIAIFLESWLVSVPAGILIVLLFRNSSPRNEQKSGFSK